MSNLPPSTGSGPPSSSPPPPPPPHPVGTGRGFMTGCLIAVAASVVLVIGAATVLVVVAGNEIERR